MEWWEAGSVYSHYANERSWKFDSYKPGDGHFFMSAPIIQLLCYWIYVCKTLSDVSYLRSANIISMHTFLNQNADDPVIYSYVCTLIFNVLWFTLFET